MTVLMPTPPEKLNATYFDAIYEPSAPALPTTPLPQICDCDFCYVDEELEAEIEAELAAEAEAKNLQDDAYASLSSYLGLYSAEKKLGPVSCCDSADLSWRVAAETSLPTPDSEIGLWYECKPADFWRYTSSLPTPIYEEGPVWASETPVWVL